MERRKVIIILILSLFVGFVAQTKAAPTLPTISFGVTEAENPQDVELSLQVLFLLTVLTLAPSILIMMTSFTRIVIVLSFIRNALSTQQMPPNQVIIGLALFMTFFIMAPTWQTINEQALEPYLAGQLPAETALTTAMGPVREFMFTQTREKDLELFVAMSQNERPDNVDGVPTNVLIPAFIISELKTAFQMGFMIFIPFMVIDMIVASTLMSMGMVMLPPSMISLPFKLMLFVLVDGWHLVVQSVLQSFS